MELEISTGQRKIGPALDFTGNPSKQVILVAYTVYPHHILVMNRKSQLFIDYIVLFMI